MSSLPLGSVLGSTAQLSAVWLLVTSPGPSSQVSPAGTFLLPPGCLSYTFPTSTPVYCLSRKTGPMYTIGDIHGGMVQVVSQCPKVPVSLNCLWLYTLGVPACPGLDVLRPCAHTTGGHAHCHAACLLCEVLAPAPGLHLDLPNKQVDPVPPDMTLGQMGS